MTVGGVVLATVVGVLAALEPDDTTQDAAQVRDCEAIPVRSGDLGESVDITMIAPSTARAGSYVDVTIDLTADGSPVTFSSTYPELVVLDDGAVAGRYRGPVPAIGFGITANSIPFTMSINTLLSSCRPAASPPDADANTGRVPLPPGEYQLVVLLIGNNDGSLPPQVVVSDPTSIVVTS